jgi:hypothetical protein
MKCIACPDISRPWCLTTAGDEVCTGGILYKYSLCNFPVSSADFNELKFKFALAVTGVTFCEN